MGILTLNEVRKRLGKGVNAAPLVLEVPADTWTPVAAFLRLTRAGEPSFLLESVEGGEHMARYSFLGSGPFETLAVEGGRARRIREDGSSLPLPGNPFLALGRRIRDFKSAPEPGLPRFCGGAVGTLDYSMIRHLEPSARIPERAGAEARLMLFGDIVAFDHLRHRMLLIANVILEDGISPAKAYGRARRALEQMRERLFKPLPARRPRRPAAAVGAARFPGGPGAEKAFLAGVAGLKSHIRAGDIFQAVLSSRADFPVAAEPFSVYRALRALNPSPYMFFVDYGAETALGASPEMLVRVEGTEVETRPIAGTRPRGGSEEEDERLEKSLLSSVKEKAEHLMLVDLGRNDVGRVSKAGSVRVPSFMKVERYSHVMHLVSSVKGRLRRGLGAWDAFASCFPAGTVTGAPKIRAMQLLAKAETAPRGLYAGAVACCDFRGNLDSAIAIRGICMKRSGRAWTAQVQAGAGIVADSSPRRELEEIRSKARVLLEAIRTAR